MGVFLLFLKQHCLAAGEPVQARPAGMTEGPRMVHILKTVAKRAHGCQVDRHIISLTMADQTAVLCSYVMIQTCPLRIHVSGA